MVGSWLIVAEEIEMAHDSWATSRGGDFEVLWVFRAL